MPKLRVEDQVRVAIRSLAGEKIAPLSREYNVSRQSIHTWRNMAHQALFNTFVPKKTGPKPQPEVEKIRRTVSNLQRTINSLRTPLLTKEARYTLGNFKCPKCNNPVVWKNGSYTLMSGEIVDRLICSQCKTRLYPPKGLKVSR